MFVSIARALRTQQLKPTVEMEMNDGNVRLLQIIVGCLYTAVPSVFLPVYLRIIYIFAKFKKYRSLECYQIMIQMGIAQCLAIAPPFVAFGLCLITYEDPFGIVNKIMKMYPSFLRTEACLGLVLALNRLKIFTGFGFRDCVQKLLSVISWLLGLTVLAFLCTPCCTYGIKPERMTTAFGSSHSSALFRRVASYILVVPPLVSFVIYMVVIVVLMRRKIAFEKPKFREERFIFVYALTRVLCDVVFVSIYHFVNYPHIPQYDVTLMLLLEISTIGVPPMLYLALYKLELDGEVGYRDDELTYL
ncbi:hypothetical protein L596_019471 [Steinernema carpocapsae]|uniref:G-protein coupled receptors family 1 profile domain-containing protein n=1 Tax=Steinernema carpocapsae TaxID=34508 RepID=A0A4U5MRG7_STECR|nr:hypothetical protein L596_019471 [Steinernema carpocapsae]